MSPTESGLALLPAVIGIFATSIGSGQLITRTGKYKIYPIIGAAVLVVALLLLSRLTPSTPYWQVALYEFAFGAGLGFTMQTIVVAVQNAVEYRDLGTATSATTFFRQMGGTVGAAVFGVVLANRLAHYLGDAFGGAAAAAGGGAVDVNNVQAIQALPEPAKGLVLSAFTRALDDVFLAGVPFVLLALAVSFFLKELPLRSGAPAPAAAGRSTGEPAPSEALSAMH
jgi:hypothetical protein